MKKAIALEIEHFENHELQNKLQRANDESEYRPYHIFSTLMNIGSQLVQVISVVLVLCSPGTMCSAS